MHRCNERQHDGRVALDDGDACARSVSLDVLARIRDRIGIDLDADDGRRAELRGGDGENGAAAAELRLAVAASYDVLHEAHDSARRLVLTCTEGHLRLDEDGARRIAPAGQPGRYDAQPAEVVCSNAFLPILG